MAAVAGISSSARSRAPRRLRVSDVMSRSPVIVAGELSVRYAARIAAMRGVDHMLVELADGRIGTVCWDHLRVAPRSAPVANWTCDPSWLGALTPDLPVDVVVEIMTERAFYC